MSVRSTLQAKQIKPSEWVEGGKNARDRGIFFCNDKSSLRGILKVVFLWDANWAVLQSCSIIRTQNFKGLIIFQVDPLACDLILI